MVQVVQQCHSLYCLNIYGIPMGPKGMEKKIVEEGNNEEKYMCIY